MSFLDDFDWKSALKAIAPTVASIFGTPLAGAGVAALLEAIFPADEVKGLSPAEQEQKLADALKSGQLTPEQYSALAQADLAFQTRCVDAGVDIERIAAGDRDSARKREIAIKDKVPAILATVFVVGFFTVLGLMFFITPPESNRDVVNILVSQGLLATLGAVVGYYYGSSANDRSSTRALADVAREMRK